MPMHSSISWKKAYGGSLLIHLVVIGLLACFLAGTAAQHEEEKMYVVDLDASELTDSGSGHAGGGGGGGSASSLFPDKLSDEAVAQRTAQIEQASSALASPQTATQPIPDAVPESLTSSPSAQPVSTASAASSAAAAAPSGDSGAGASGSSSDSGSGGGSGTGSGTGTGSGEGSGSGSGYGSGSGLGAGDGVGDGQGYGEGSGSGSGSGDSGSSGTGSGPFDTDGFWAAVNANKSYPPMAAKRGLTGTVNVTVTLDAGGNCVSASASGDPILAKAATKAVYAACPYPNPTGASITINVPVTFELQ